jgi:preprotein translocase subunit YajC
MFNFIFSALFLLAPPSGAPGEQPNPLVQLVPMILIIVVFYFFMIRPQQQKQKEREKALDALKKGDKIVTIGGLHGRISGIDNEKKTVEVEVANGLKLKFDRTAIASVEKSEGKSETAEKLEATA